MEMSLDLLMILLHFTVSTTTYEVLLYVYNYKMRYWRMSKGCWGGGLWSNKREKLAE